MLIEAYTYIYIYTHKNIRINTYTYAHIMCIYGLRGLTGRRTCEIRAAAGAKSCKSSPLVHTSPPITIPAVSRVVAFSRPTAKAFRATPSPPSPHKYHPLRYRRRALCHYIYACICSSYCSYIYIWLFMYIYMCVYLNKCIVLTRVRTSRGFEIT